MQNSELYRRGVVFPRDEISENQLRKNDVDTCTEVRLLSIPNESAFRELWNLGLFHQINQRCGTLIDDYEEDWVEATAVKEVLAVVDAVVTNVVDPSLKKFLLELRLLAREALVSARPLLFVL